MKWNANNTLSLPVIFGFPITVRPSALIALVFLLFGTNRLGLFGGLAYVAIAFGSVLVHELGHALAAKREQIGVSLIELHGFGGLTRFVQQATPQQSIRITLAGPAAGLALAAAGFLVHGMLQVTGVPGPVLLLLQQVIRVNVFWSLFNLLPMYPMDGGVLLYQYLVQRKVYRETVQWTARIGLGTAIAVGLWGLFGSQLFLVIIAGLCGYQSYAMLKANP